MYQLMSYVLNLPVEIFPILTCDQATNESSLHPYDVKVGETQSPVSETSFFK
jgi:hypothetical protein